MISCPINAFSIDIISVKASLFSVIFDSDYKLLNFLFQL